MKLIALTNDTRFSQILAARLGMIGCCLASFQGEDDAVERLDAEAFDAALIDMDRDEVSDTRRFLQRAAGKVIIAIATPTNTSKLIDLIAGGADDFIFKPLDFTQLIMRIRMSAIRRGQLPKSPETIGKLRYEPLTGEMWLADNLVDIPPREMRILEILICNSHRDITADKIRDSIANLDEDLSVAAVKTYVSRLRRRLVRHGMTISANKSGGYRLA